MKAEAEGINGYDSGTTPVAVKFVKGKSVFKSNIQSVCLKFCN